MRFPPPPEDTDEDYVLPAEYETGPAWVGVLGVVGILVGIVGLFMAVFS
jgi:hypothetical protein